MRIAQLDHFVLTVRDIDTTCNFYRRVMGMEIHTFGESRRALRFGQHQINLHEAGKEFEPKALRPTPGSGDLCFLTDTPIEDVIAHLNAQGVTVELGPVPRSGAAGAFTSVYFRDPDGNLIEVSKIEP